MLLVGCNKNQRQSPAISKYSGRPRAFQMKIYFTVPLPNKLNRKDFSVGQTDRRTENNRSPLQGKDKCDVACVPGRRILIILLFQLLFKEI